MPSLKALLVNPWVYDFACYDLFSKPIGFLQIAACLKSLGFKVSLIDCMDRLHPELLVFSGQMQAKSYGRGQGNYYSEGVSKPDILKGIPRQYKRYGIPPALFEKLLKNEPRPDIILVTSGMTYWYNGVFEAIGILKNKFPRTKIILGGIYPALCYPHAVKYSGADYVFKGGNIKEIIGVISGLLNRSFVLRQDYFSPAYELYQKIDCAALRTSSGCPFKCSYCGWYLLEPDFSQREPDDVLVEIELYYEKLGIRNFSFYDDALLFDPRGHIEKILGKVLEKNIKANFHTPNGLHARFLTPETAVLLKKTGFIRPRFGFETADLKLQQATGGKVNNRELARAVSLLKKAGYKAGEIEAYLLIGLPGQGSVEIEDSIRMVHRLGIRSRLEEYSPIPGTVDYERAGLPPDMDPLLHNNSIFPAYGRQQYAQFQRLKDLNHRLK